MPHHGEGVDVAGVVHYARYLWDLFIVRGWAAMASPANWASIVPFQAEYAVTIDRIFHHNDTVSAGNFRAGIYADNGDTPVGGALLAESAAVATTGVNQKQEVPIPPLSLPAGLYWLAHQKDDDADRLYIHPQAESAGGTLIGRAYALAFGPFTNPCPAAPITNSPTQLGVRVASVP